MHGLQKTAMVKIELPYPDKLLNPNSCAHWKAKMKAKEDARTLAQYMAVKHKGVFAKEDTLLMLVEFLFTDARRRDLDNLLASCKHTLDGVFLGLGIDDSQVQAITLKKHKKSDKQNIIVTISKD